MALKKTASEAPKPAPKAPAKAAAKPAAAKAAAPPPPPAKAAAAVNVTLKQLASELADAHELSKKQAETVMGGLITAMTNHLKAGDRLRLGGFGILEVKNRPARSGRNPATGAAIQIAASKKISFRPAKELKEAV